MPETEPREPSLWPLLLMTIGVAIIAMFITVRFREGGPPDAASVTPSGVEAARAPALPEGGTADPPPEEEPASSYSPPPAGNTFGIAPPRGARAVSQPSPLSAPPAAAPMSGAPPKNFHEMVMTERVKMRAVWDRHLETSPMLRAYVKEWRSTPELMALKEHWHKEYNPIAFLKGLAGEPKFFQLLGKYGKSPEFVSVLKDDMNVASPEALSAAGKTLNTESVIKDLMNKVSGATGLPIGAWLGGRPTQEDVLKAVLNNPNLKTMPGNDPNRRR